VPLLNELAGSRARLGKVDILVEFTWLAIEHYLIFFTKMFGQF
jgi:hypothetical protein